MPIARCALRVLSATCHLQKGSYWYVDLSEEYSTPRIRIREPKKQKKDGDMSASPPPTAAPSTRSRKRKTSQEVSSLATFPNKAARPADLKLPPANPALMQRGRLRAISAPSPSTPSFFGGGSEMHSAQSTTAAGLHGLYINGPPGAPAFFQPGYPTFSQPNGHAGQHQQQYSSQGYSPFVATQLGASAHSTQQTLHLYRDEGNASIDARPTSAQSAVADGRPATAEPVVKEEPLEVDVPSMVPDSGKMPDTGSTLTTPRSIFSKMLEKSTAAAALLNVGAGGVINSVNSPPPGSVASYAFPHAGVPASAPPGTRITIPPTIAAAANGTRPAPLKFLNKDLRRAYSPPISAMAQSPTRLLPSKDYDTLFSSMPFGMMFGDGTGKRPSRSGSIFGLSARS